MIDLEFLQALIRSIDESSIDSVEIERGGTRVRVSKTPDVAPAPVYPGAAVPAPIPAPSVGPPAPVPHSEANPGTAASAVEEGAGAPDTAGAGNLVDITSPMVGTFYRAASPESDPYVSEGSSVSAGDTLCIIEAMKLMNELEADVGGVIREICVENAEPVEYGQVLFRVEPN